MMLFTIHIKLSQNQLLSLIQAYRHTGIQIFATNDAFALHTNPFGTSTGTQRYKEHLATTHP